MPIQTEIFYPCRNGEPLIQNSTPGEVVCQGVKSYAHWITQMLLEEKELKMAWLITGWMVSTTGKIYLKWPKGGGGGYKPFSSRDDSDRLWEGFLAQPDNHTQNGK